MNDQELKEKLAYILYSDTKAFTLELNEILKLIQQKVIEAQQSLICEYQQVLSIKQDGSQISLYEFGQIMNMDKKRMWHNLDQLNHNKKGDSNEQFR